MHKHLRLPPFTRLREFMQGNDITPASVYTTGIISRRRLLDLLNGTGQPALRTAIALARHFAGVLHRPVWVGELFEIGDESAIRQAITAHFPFFEVLEYETGQPAHIVVWHVRSVRPIRPPQSNETVIARLEFTNGDVLDSSDNVMFVLDRMKEALAPVTERLLRAAEGVRQCHASEPTP